MKFSLIILLVLTVSCKSTVSTKYEKKTYYSKGFAYIYNEKDYDNEIINKKIRFDEEIVFTNDIKRGALLKISNPRNGKNIIAKNSKKIKYPDFYKVLITNPVAEKIDLDLNLPILEITEVRKNKSFVAKEAKIFQEEKKIPSKAPVASVQISNISKNKIQNNKKKTNHIYILIGSFYSMETAKFLKERIVKDVPNLDTNKLIVKKINDKETHVISGPYNSVNSLKNDYIKIKNFGFEELDIFTNE